jgi:hypothetical protein
MSLNLLSKPLVVAIAVCIHLVSYAAFKHTTTVRRCCIQPAQSTSPLTTHGERIRAMVHARLASGVHHCIPATNRAVWLVQDWPESRVDIATCAILWCIQDGYEMVWKRAVVDECPPMSIACIFNYNQRHWLEGDI